MISSANSATSFSTVSCISTSSSLVCFFMVRVSGSKFLGLNAGSAELREGWIKLDKKPHTYILVSCFACLSFPKSGQARFTRFGCCSKRHGVEDYQTLVLLTKPAEFGKRVFRAEKVTLNLDARPEMLCAWRRAYLHAEFCQSQYCHVLTFTRRQIHSTPPNHAAPKHVAMENYPCDVIRYVG